MTRTRRTLGLLTLSIIATAATGVTTVYLGGSAEAAPVTPVPASAPHAVVVPV